jgi:osmotically-inducible protein OsmY
MYRKFSILVVFLTIFGLACGSINRVIPTDEAMKADVKGKIAEVYPKEATQIGVTVNDGVVTLTGTVESAVKAQKIGEAANSVHGVKQVINNIQVQ